MPLTDFFDMTEEQARDIFREERWPETGGEPVCPDCGGLNNHWLENQKRWKCKNAGCRKQFTITSGTIFAHRRMPYKELLFAIRLFSAEAKGNTAVSLSKDIKRSYKVAWVFQSKCREGYLNDGVTIHLQGDVEIDGGWFGGYVKPQNIKANRVDRRLKDNQNGKRRVVVGVRERRPGGRTIVGIFDTEDEARCWVQDHIAWDAVIYSDDATAWIDLRATHEVRSVNHSERYADGDVNSNQMESFFSRLRRMEVGTHHHIAGTKVKYYAWDGAWRENNKRSHDLDRTRQTLRLALRSKPSRDFSNLWRKRAGRDDNDVFAAFA